MYLSKYVYVLLLVLFCLCISCQESDDPDLPLIEDDIGQTIGDSMILCLPFDNNGLDMVNENHLTIINNCEFVNDRLGNPLSAISLNGIDSYIDILSPISRAPDKFSISFWMKNLSLTSNQAYIFCLRESSYCNIVMDVYDMEATLRFKRHLAPDPFRSVRNEINANEWIYVVLNYKKQELLELYINSESKQKLSAAELTYNSFSEESSIISAIGCLNNSNNESKFWKGEIDDVRIYDKLLSTEEIKYLFEN